MDERLEEIKQMLDDVSNIPNEFNTLMISASDYIDDVKYLIDIIEEG